MIKLTEKTGQVSSIDATLTLPLHSRIKSRLRVILDNGEDAGLFLERGTTLKDGDMLRTDDGFSVLVKAAEETLSTVISDDPHLLARACYHLGNRHVSIQIEPKRVSYIHDHVLDVMLRGLGMEVTTSNAPFEPEPGAYGGSAEKGHKHHGHSHGHQH
ncbi:MAG: urease accessory protein UreE [Candidatus Sedimenticola sp. PURPLELP]